MNTSSAGHPTDQTMIVWRKSSHSNGNGGECVEVASVAGRHLTRDSKNPTGPTLTFTSAEWKTFLDDLRAR